MFVMNPKVIDFMFKSNDNSELKLVIVDHLDWTNQHEHLDRLREKINAYIGFYETKQYLNAYKDLSENLDCCVIHLHLKYNIPQNLSGIFKSISEQLCTYGITFEYTILKTETQKEETAMRIKDKNSVIKTKLFKRFFVIPYGLWFAFSLFMLLPSEDGQDTLSFGDMTIVNIVFFIIWWTIVYIICWLFLKIKKMVKKMVRKNSRDINIGENRINETFDAIKDLPIIPINKSLNALKEEDLTKIYILLENYTGKYTLNELDFPFERYNFLEFTYSPNKTLTYNVPKYNNEIKLYNISEELIKQMNIYYNEKNELDKIEIINDETNQLIYINFLNYDIAKSKINEFAILEAKKLVEKLKTYNNEILRLFIESFYDGEAADISLVIGTKEDAEEIIKKYCGDESVINNSGDYSEDNRISIANENLEVMLRCIDEKYSNELFNYCVEVITSYIKENLDNNITKANDFKFILAEHDKDGVNLLENRYSKEDKYNKEKTLYENIKNALGHECILEGNAMDLYVELSVDKLDNKKELELEFKEYISKNDIENCFKHIMESRYKLVEVNKEEWKGEIELKYFSLEADGLKRYSVLAKHVITLLEESNAKAYRIIDTDMDASWKWRNDKYDEIDRSVGITNEYPTVCTMTTCYETEKERILINYVEYFND